MIVKIFKMSPLLFIPNVAGTRRLLDKNVAACLGQSVHSYDVLKLNCLCVKQLRIL